MAARKLRWRKDGIRFLSKEEALWQYILDHARPATDGSIIAAIGIKNKAQFQRSILARQTGLYRFTEKDVFAQKPIKIKVKHPGIRKRIRKLLHYLLSII